MSRKNTIVVLGAVLMSALLVGAGVAAAGFTNGGDAPRGSLDQQTNDTDDRSITVSASGDVQAEPDQALVRLSIQATDDDPAEARSMVAENTSNVREALADLGLDDDQVRTTGFNIYEDRQRPANPEDEPEVTYRARHQLEVELDDVDRAGEVIDAAVDAGATHVNGVQFTLSEDTQQELRQEALREAMERARLQAETIAESEDLAVTNLRSATTDDVRIPIARMEYAAMADSNGAAASTSVEPGDVTVSATVSVQYDVSE